MSEEESTLHPVNFTSLFDWGERGPEEDDPAEAYHEAAKLTVAEGVTTGAMALEADPVAQQLLGRPVKRNPNLPSVVLPKPEYPAKGLGELIGERESRRDFGSKPVSLQDLSTLLHAAYGIIDAAEPDPISTPMEPAPYGFNPAERPWRRSVPSGGALYPLEIYPAIRNVDGVNSGLYHYDPLKHHLEVIEEREMDDQLQRLLTRRPELPDSAGTCAAVLFVAGIFWRTRFKYAVRGYRLALLEAGHVAQNFLLAAECLGLNAFPNIAFWDRKVDDFLGLDGVNESVFYSLVAGSPLGD